ncbi:MAG: J domain-containing protein [Sphingomonas sp.]|uniref:J domain-containing protein n=1 Tax=Sphingomonas sp. TaxID=28214 RepID=UPI001ACBFE75|nr:DnaJ domain-containing protein [Sphingomonas sp.]MBN8809073.1 J domain-containing protein [Sphingomonas sp.]
MPKLLLALAIAWFGWWLWQGPKRVHTSGRRPNAPPRPPAPVRPTDQASALAILGLDGHASDDDIRAAHRRLLRSVHPDHGGSADLAQRVNAARDTLLRRPD